MNDQKPQKPQYRSVKTKLREVLKETWSLYKKNFLGFMGLFLLPVVLGAGLRFGLFKVFKSNSLTSQENIQTLNYGLLIGGFIVMVVLGWLIQLLGVNTTMRGAHLADTKGNLPFADAFREGLSKLGKAAGLSVRVFFYTGAWIIAILAVLMGVGMLATILAAQDSGSPFVQTIRPFLAMMGMLPLVMIVVIIFLIRRICQAVFAFPILLSKEVSSKEALAESIQLADGLTGVIFANYFLFGLLVAIVAGVFTQLFMQLIGLVYPSPDGTMQLKLDYIQNMTDYASIIPGMLIGSFSIVFQYAFMKKAREEKTDQSGMTMESPKPAQPTGGAVMS